MRSSWATISETSKGVYRIRYWSSGPEGYKRRSKTVRGTRKQAEEVRASLMLNHAKDAPCPTLTQAFNAWWLPNAQAQVEAFEKYGKQGGRTTIKPATYKLSVSVWNNHIKPQFGSCPLDSIRYSQMQEFLDTKTENVAQRILAVMRETYRFAMLNEVIDKNIMEYSYRMPVKAKKQSTGVYTLEQLNSELWRRIYNEPYEGAYILAAYCGCRVGESLGVKLEDIEPAEYNGIQLATISIKRQVSNYGKVSKDSDLKNKWSERITIAPPPYAERLLDIKRRGEQKGYTWLSDNFIGEPISQDIMRKEFEKVLAQTDLPREQIRALRRSWRTWISAQGISQELLEKVMGHIGQGTTATNYLKPYREVLVEEFGKAFLAKPVTVGLAWLEKS